MATFFIIDDEPVLHELYKNILELTEHTVVGEAFNGLEGYEKVCALEEKPDFILMDHRMPEKDGVTTTKELIEKYPDLKIVFVSADKSVKELALAAGATAFLGKPFSLEKLFSILGTSI